MKLPADVREAVTLLEAAEADFPSNDSADAFSEAWVLLDDCCTGGVTDTELADYLANVRLSYTRRLVTGTLTLPLANSALWLPYVALLHGPMGDEVQRLRALEPELLSALDQRLARLTGS